MSQGLPELTPSMMVLCVRMPWHVQQLHMCDYSLGTSMDSNQPAYEWVLHISTIPPHTFMDCIQRRS